MTVETKPEDIVNETIVGGLGETSGIVEIAQLVGNVVLGLASAAAVSEPIKDEKSKKDPDCIR
jgi:hypothetical protein